MAFAPPVKAAIPDDVFNISFSAMSKENESSQFPSPTKSQVWKSPTKAKVETSVVSPSLKTQIKQLEKKREDLEEAGRYLEAKDVHDLLLKLKVSEEAKRKDSLKQNRKQELKYLEEAYELELQAVRKHFDEELKEFELKVEQGLAEMQLKQEDALAEYSTKVQIRLQEIPTSKFAPSKRLLEMRRAEKALARQHEYKEAHEIKVEADELQKQEIIDRIARIRRDLIAGEERLKEKLRHELAVFDQRNESIRATIEENRRIEETTVNQRFQNKRSELLSSTTRVETVLDRRIEQLSPTKPVNRSRLSLNNSQMNSVSFISAD